MANIALPGGECRSVSDALADLDALLNEACPALPTGIDALDEALSGGVRGWFVVIGGAPGAGKSDLALNAAMSIALYRPVYYVTFELSARQLVVRVITSASAQGDLRHALTAEDLLDRRKEGANPVLLARAKDKLAPVAKAMHVEDHTTVGSDGEILAVSHLARLAQAVKNEKGVPAAFVVDYVQQFPVGGDSSAAANTDFLDRLARDLASLAHRSETPVLALSSMTKTGDYRGSSHLEHAADVALIVSHEKAVDDSPMSPATMVIEVRKHRDGRAGIKAQAQYWPAYHHIR